MLSQTDSDLLRDAFSFWNKITKEQQDFLIENSFHTTYQKKRSFKFRQSRLLWGNSC